MFQFPGLALNPYVFRAQYLLMISVNLKVGSRQSAIGSRMISTAYCRLPALKLTEIEGGFPHSEIRGSKLIRSSPRLIAAYHVLHRLSAPRHPPNALKALDRSHDRCPRDLRPPRKSGNHFCDKGCRRKRATYDQKDHLCLPNVPDSTRADGVGLLARCRMSSSRIHSLFTMTNSSAKRRFRRWRNT